MYIPTIKLTVILPFVLCTVATSLSTYFEELYVHVCKLFLREALHVRKNKFHNVEMTDSVMSSMCMLISVF